MHVVLLVGGIASGKSTVARELLSRGARLVDLDVLSREVTQPGSSVNLQIAQAFGKDVLDDGGALRREALAQRAFASAETTVVLERIVHPAIRERLALWLAEQDEDSLCVVEVPLLDRVEDLISLADEVLYVACPRSERRVRAIARGMTGTDFDARADRQPSDDYLIAHATTVIDNTSGERELLLSIDEWWRQRSGKTCNNAAETNN